MLTEGSHHQLTEHAVFHLHIHDLTVHHIVVAGIHAASIRTMLDRLANLGLIRLLRQDVAGPICVAVQDARVFVGQIDLLCVIGAILLGFAARRASRRRALRCTFGSEMTQAAKARHPRAALARQKDQIIQIMAAFGQQHERRFRLAAPVSAHKAVRLMPVTHILQRLNAHQLTDLSAFDRIRDRLKERRIAQHMANHHAAVHSARRFLDLLHILL